MAKDRAAKERAKARRAAARNRRTTKRQAKQRRLETLRTEKEEFDREIRNSSSVIGTPARFRSLSLESLPDMDDGFTIADLDLHLLWYETQEARAKKEGGETVSALTVDVC